MCSTTGINRHVWTGWKRDLATLGVIKHTNRCIRCGETKSRLREESDESYQRSLESPGRLAIAKRGGATLTSGRRAEGHYDRWFLHEAAERIQFIVVDSSLTVAMAGDGEQGFRHAVGIMAKKRRGEPRIFFPAVHTDLTFADGLPIVEVAIDEVPDEVLALLPRHPDRKRGRRPCVRCGGMGVHRHRVGASLDYVRICACRSGAPGAAAR